MKQNMAAIYIAVYDQIEKNLSLTVFCPHIIASIRAITLLNISLPSHNHLTRYSQGGFGPGHVR